MVNDSFYEKLENQNETDNFQYLCLVTLFTYFHRLDNIQMLL